MKNENRHEFVPRRGEVGGNYQIDAYLFSFDCSRKYDCPLPESGNRHEQIFIIISKLIPVENTKRG